MNTPETQTPKLTPHQKALECIALDVNPALLYRTDTEYGAVLDSWWHQRSFDETRIKGEQIALTAEPLRPVLGTPRALLQGIWRWRAIYIGLALSALIAGLITGRADVYFVAGALALFAAIEWLWLSETKTLDAAIEELRQRDAGEAKGYPIPPAVGRAPHLLEIVNSPGFHLPRSANKADPGGKLNPTYCDCAATLAVREVVHALYLRTGFRQVIAATDGGTAFEIAEELHQFTYAAIQRAARDWPTQRPIQTESPLSA